MTAPVKSPKSAPGGDGHTPGGDAYLLPDLPDVMGGWMSMTTTNLQAWQGEWQNFVARRIEHDQRTFQRFAACRDLMEAAKIQQDWLTETYESYLEESRRFARIALEPEAKGAPKAGKPSVGEVA